MDLSTFHPSIWPSLFTSPLLFPYHFVPANYVHWTETPESHIYSADLPAMDLSTFHPSIWPSLFTSPLLFPYHFVPANYVHWTETPESHIYSADLPGVRKEEIRVEVEDSRYLIIRTEAMGESAEPGRRFSRKFRLPAMVDVHRIAAGYENGVLRVTVPRSFVRRGFYIEPSDLPERLEVMARAA